ncbi:MAG: hypothetical protein ACK4VW_08290 [Anaerolineales bacterium]
MKLLDERSSLTNHAALFVEHADALKSLHCHTIYTVPVSLLNDRNLGMAYPDLDMIPMVKVSTPDGKVHPQGIEMLKQVIGKRANISSVFADESDLDKFIQMSGGVLRDPDSDFGSLKCGQAGVRALTPRSICA